MWNQTQTTIGHLTVRDQGSSLERHTLRLRLERLLSGVDLHPPGFTSGAVLVVRKLQALPALPISALSHFTQPAWTESLHRQIEALYTLAARPALGPVDPDAISVLFVDPGEMLICLTRDLFARRAWQQWYWRQLLRNKPHTTPSAALTVVWVEQAASVPAVLGSLHITEVRAALAQFSYSEVAYITHALHKSFDLSSTVLTELLEPETVMPSSMQHDRASSGEQPALPLEEVSTDYPIAPPWQRWLPCASVPMLTLQAHYLLGLGLTLYHAPAFARSSQFAAQAVMWLRSERSAEYSHEASYLNVPRRIAITEFAQHRHMEKTATLSSVLETLPARVMSESEQEKVVHAQGEVKYSTMASEYAQGEAEYSPAEPEYMQENAPTIHEQNSSPDAQARHKQVSPSGAQAAWEFVFGTRQHPSEGIATELGGILYLVNLLTRLKLPGSWDEDGTFAECLSGWSIIETLARGLLGTLHTRYVDDPIWDMLAHLDHREPGTPAGAALPPQDTFRLPAQWLRQSGITEATWVAIAEDSCLRLFDEITGYLIVDVPLSDRLPDAVRQREIEGYRTQGIAVTLKPSTEAQFAIPFLRRASLAPLLGENTLWWAERVLGFIQYLLARFLDEAEGDMEQLAELLLCKQGDLLVSRTHIDLYMPMEQINMPVRRSGLDRDPGWVPDLGQIVLFHFD